MGCMACSGRFVKSCIALCRDVHKAALLGSPSLPYVLDCLFCVKRHLNKCPHHSAYPDMHPLCIIKQSLKMLCVANSEGLWLRCPMPLPVGAVSKGGAVNSRLSEVCFDVCDDVTVSTLVLVSRHLCMQVVYLLGHVDQ